MMKSGVLSQTVAIAAIHEEELRALERVQPEKAEQQTARADSGRCDRSFRFDVTG
jgi:hypothetical protein